MKKISLIYLTLAALMLFPTLSACTKVSDAPQTSTYYKYFDTVSHIYSYANDSEKAFADNCTAVANMLEKYHRLFDIYYQYSGINNLRTVNDNAGIAPVEVDRELIDFLIYSKEMHEKTNGEMNIAMGSVLSIWHERREEAAEDQASARLPDGNALSKAAKHISIDSIVIDPEASTVYISDPDTKIDIGAVGKGYVAEKAAALLMDKGASSYVLDIGGNIRIIGEKPNGGGWITGITNPDKNSDEAYALRLELSDTSCVTSGNYERYYTVNGKDYHHIIDRDTLYPSEYFASVTVICKDSSLADALSTALFCMSREDGDALVSKLDGVHVIWIYQSGEIKMTEGVKDLIKN